MDDSTHERPPFLSESRPDAERAFWRRAVAIERARQNCGRPAQFPFQDY